MLLRVDRPAGQRVGMARVIFLTDVEGNWDYFCRFVHRSEGMSFIGDGTFAPHDVALLDGYSLVFGGDAGDKGPGTLRFVRAMLSLKERYPDRVVLLLGNRDINKMRFTSELAGAEIANPRARESPYWVPAKKAVTPFAFLCKVAADAEGLEAEAVAIRPDLVEKHNTKKNRLLWMLNDTMGSMGDFDRRATGEECCFLVFVGLFLLNFPLLSRFNLTLIEKASPCRAQDCQRPSVRQRNLRR
eukprot:SAG31_NODE_349_length_17243_cov_7.408248_2_plen_243_part_00